MIKKVDDHVKKVKVVHVSRLVVPAARTVNLRPRTALSSKKINHIDRLASIRRAPGKFFELYGSDYTSSASFRKASCLVAKSPAANRQTDRQTEHIFEVRREAPALLWKGHRKILAAQEIPFVRLCVRSRILGFRNRLK